MEFTAPVSHYVYVIVKQFYTRLCLGIQDCSIQSGLNIPQQQGPKKFHETC